MGLWGQYYREAISQTVSKGCSRFEREISGNKKLKTMTKEIEDLL
jgi:hypothetical protein